MLICFYSISVDYLLYYFKHVELKYSFSKSLEGMAPSFLSLNRSKKRFKRKTKCVYKLFRME